MTDKEKTIKELKEVLDSLDITNKYRLNLIRAIEYLQEEPKFKVGQSIRQSDVVAKIVEVSEEGYHCDNAFVPFIAQDSWELVEEPVSIDFEQELYKAFGQVKDFTLGMRIAKWFYDMGKNSQDPVSEELEKAAWQYADQTYDDSGFRLCATEAFEAGAKWQKEQMTSKGK